MIYVVKEIFYMLQGEGVNVGWLVVFCWFVGCNLWLGCEEDCVEVVCCFCDMDFVGIDGENGGKFKDVVVFVVMIVGLWLVGEVYCFVVCMGGELMLQFDQLFVDVLYVVGFEIVIEINGLLLVFELIDWICVSLKVDVLFVVMKGNELKVVVLQDNQWLVDYVKFDFEYFFVQLMDGLLCDFNMKFVIDWCKCYLQWWLLMQIYKYLNIF